MHGQLEVSVMALRRVPGTKNYYANDAGLAQVANSSAMSKAMVASARDIAGVAASVGKSKYGVKPATVTAGWDNERRAGAVVYESDVHLADWRDTVLKRVADAMGRRGGR